MGTTLTPQQLANQLRARSRSLASGVAVDALRERAIALLQADILSNFEESHDPDGVPWLPLKKPRADGSKKPLVRTGKLRDSFLLLKSNARTSGSLSTLLLRSDVPYAIFHQRGTRHIPKRRFIGIGKRVKIKLKTAVADWLAGWIKGDELAGG